MNDMVTFKQVENRVITIRNHIVLLDSDAASYMVWRPKK
jgi:hypothetical protein